MSLPKRPDIQVFPKALAALEVLSCARVVAEKVRAELVCEVVGLRSWRNIAVTLIFMEISQISFGDRVRIRSTGATETLGIAGQMGIVNGRTTPSVTGVEVVGKSTKNLAIAVTLEAQTKQLWFAEEVLEFVDHGAGTIVETQGRKLIRDEQGSWREVKKN